MSNNIREVKSNFEQLADRFAKAFAESVEILMTELKSNRQASQKIRSDYENFETSIRQIPKPKEMGSSSIHEDKPEIDPVVEQTTSPTPRP